MTRLTLVFRANKQHPLWGNFLWGLLLWGLLLSGHFFVGPFLWGLLLWSHFFVSLICPFLSLSLAHLSLGDFRGLYIHCNSKINCLVKLFRLSASDDDDDCILWRCWCQQIVGFTLFIAAETLHWPRRLLKCEPAIKM